MPTVPLPNVRLQDMLHRTSERSYPGAAGKITPEPEPLDVTIDPAPRRPPTQSAGRVDGL